MYYFIFRSLFYKLLTALCISILFLAGNTFQIDMIWLFFCFCCFGSLAYCAKAYLFRSTRRILVSNITFLERLLIYFTFFEQKVSAGQHLHLSGDMKSNVSVAAQQGVYFNQQPNPQQQSQSQAGPGGNTNNNSLNTNSQNPQQQNLVNGQGEYFVFV